MNEPATPAAADALAAAYSNITAVADGLPSLRCGAGQGGDRTELAILRASSRVMVLDEAGCSRKIFMHM
jgi:hypothetical protein